VKHLVVALVTNFIKFIGWFMLSFLSEVINTNSVLAELTEYSSMYQTFFLLYSSPQILQLTLSDGYYVGASS